MNSNKIRYINVKNKLQSIGNIIKGLKELSKNKTITEVNYDNLDIINKHLITNYNEIIPILEKEGITIENYIIKYEYKYNCYKKEYNRLKNKVDKKYHDCNFFAEVLFL